MMACIPLTLVLFQLAYHSDFILNDIRKILFPWQWDPILPSFVGLLHWSGGLRVGGGATVWPPWNFCSPEWGMQVRVRTVSEERCGRGQKS